MLRHARRTSQGTFDAHKGKQARRHIAGIAGERERVQATLRASPAISDCTDSHANFVLAKPADPKALIAALEQRRVLVRRFTEDSGLKDMIRVSIGTPAENDLFLEAVKSCEAGAP